MIFNCYKGWLRNGFYLLGFANQYPIQIVFNPILKKVPQKGPVNRIHNGVCMLFFLKTDTVNLLVVPQIYFRDSHLHHQCYGYAKMAPIAAIWSKPLQAGGTPITVIGSVSAYL